MKNSMRRCIGLFTSFAICFSFSFVCYGIESKKDVGKDICNIVAETLVENGDYSKRQVLEINEEIETLDDMGMPIELIEEGKNTRDGNIYILKIDESTTNEISIIEKTDTETTIQVKEGTLVNELQELKNGDIYLDGQLVKFTGSEEDLKTDFETSVDGVTFTKKAPSEVKAWRDYSLNWVCSSIKLQKKISNVATSVILGLLTKSTAGVIASAVASDLITNIKSKDPYSTGISYKIWAANSKKPVTSRYTKLKQKIYSRVNFKNYSKSVVFYSRKG